MENIPVIILNWNGLDDTMECIESVLKQDYPNFTIYLVDNGSEPEEYIKLTEKYSNNPRIILQKNDTNLGFTIAHNQLFDQLKNSHNEFIALINNDAIADQEWLKNALTRAQKENADLVACLMLDYYNRQIIDSAGLFLLSSGEILPLGHDLPINQLPQQKVKPIAACGGACLYRLSMLNEIGTFDPYFSTGYEDAELGLRAFLAVKKIEFEPTSIVYHKMSRSVSKVFNRNKAQKIQEDIYYTYLKLTPAGVIFINALFNIPRWFIVMTIHLITLRFRFLAIQIRALFKTIKESERIYRARKEYRKFRKIGAIDLLKAQQFFLFYDLNRFSKFIMRHQKNQFEKYESHAENCGHRR